MRLGYVAGCLVGLVACAQGVQDNEADLIDTAGSSSFAGTGQVGSAGSLNRAGTGSSVAGTGSGVAGSGSAGRGGSGAGGAGSAGAAGKAGGVGTSGGPGVGGGTGEQGCSHPQPGSTGFTLSYQAKDAADSVPYIYFRVEIKNPDDPVALTDLKLRYYFNNDLTSPATDFYSPQVKHANGNTDNLGANDVTATFTPTYLEVGFTSAALLATGETLQFEVHMHATPSPTPHTQTGDYSFKNQTAIAPWCNITLHQSTALAWGTPP